MSRDRPRCPYCDEPAELRVRTTRYRRGEREVSVPTRFWECPLECEGPDGARPFRFENPHLLRSNDEAARSAWQAQFGEPMPTSRRPGRKPSEPREVRVQLRLTRTERQEMDRLRGGASLSNLVRERALQRYGSPRAPGFPLVENEDPEGPHRRAV
jgi:hypothetical protein